MTIIIPKSSLFSNWISECNHRNNQMSLWYSITNIQNLQHVQQLKNSTTYLALTEYKNMQILPRIPLLSRSDQKKKNMLDLRTSAYQLPRALKNRANQLIKQLSSKHTYMYIKDFQSIKPIYFNFTPSVPGLMFRNLNQSQLKYCFTCNPIK